MARRTLQNQQIEDQIAILPPNLNQQVRTGVASELYRGQAQRDLDANPYGDPNAARNAAFWGGTGVQDELEQARREKFRELNPDPSYVAPGRRRIASQKVRNYTPDKAQTAYRNRLTRSVETGEFTPEIASKYYSDRGYDDMPPQAFAEFLPPQIQTQRAEGDRDIRLAEGTLTQQEISDIAKSETQAERDQATSIEGLKQEGRIDVIGEQTEGDVAKIKTTTEGQKEIIGTESTARISEGKAVSDATESLATLTNALDITMNREGVINAKELNEHTNNLTQSLDKSRSEILKGQKKLESDLTEFSDAANYQRNIGKMDKVAEITETQMEIAQEHQLDLDFQRANLQRLKDTADDLRAKGQLELAAKLSRAAMLQEASINKDQSLTDAAINKIQSQQDADNQKIQLEVATESNRVLQEEEDARTAEEAMKQWEREEVTRNTVAQTPAGRLETQAIGDTSMALAKKQALTNAGVADIDQVYAVISEVVSDSGRPGMGGFNSEATISKATSAINVYNQLTSDPQYGEQFRLEFENNPEWRQFVDKVEGWRSAGSANPLTGIIPPIGVANYLGASRSFDLPEIVSHSAQLPPSVMR